MTDAPPRAPVHHARLLHFLDPQAPPPHASPSGNVGEQLADWLDFRQAIDLQAFMGSVNDAQAAAVRPTARIDAAVLRQRFAQVRQALESAILNGTAPAPGLARIEPPPQELAQPIDPRTAFEPLRRYSLGHQRQMDSILRSLRTQLRGMLDKGSAQHRQLAALDAIFENVLQAHQARVLARIHARFEKQFAQALRQHMKPQPPTGEAQTPAAGAWLAPLCEDMRQALLAELDLRLQPLLGLIDTLAPHAPDTPTSPDTPTTA